MKKIIKVAIVLTILSSPIIFSAYKTTCILPYYWDKKANLLVLLGQEKGGAGYVWSDFCGRKENKNKNAYTNAITKLKKETASQLKIRSSKEQAFSYHDKLTSTIHYILPVYYVDPDTINNAVQVLCSKKKGKNVEKTRWQWISVKDLLRGITNLKFAESFNKKLQIKGYRQYLEKLIAQRPLILLKKASTIYKKCKKTGKQVCTCPR
jgi:hypothetical protein